MPPTIESLMAACMHRDNICDTFDLQKMELMQINIQGSSDNLFSINNKPIS